MACRDDAIPLSLLTYGLIRTSYTALLATVDKLPHLSAEARREVLRTTLKEMRIQFARLLVVVRHSIALEDVALSARLRDVHLSRASVGRSAADAIWAIQHSFLKDAKLPICDMLAAVDMLSSGSYYRLPLAVAYPTMSLDHAISAKVNAPSPLSPTLRPLPPEAPDAASTEALVNRINHCLRVRLMCSKIPSEFLTPVVRDGLVVMTAPGEFEVEITALDGFELHHPWTLLKLRMLLFSSSTPGSISNPPPYALPVAEITVERLKSVVQSILRGHAQKQPLGAMYKATHTVIEAILLERLAMQVASLSHDESARVTMDLPKKITMVLWPNAPLRGEIVFTVARPKRLPSSMGTLLRDTATGDDGIPSIAAPQENLIHTAIRITGDPEIVLKINAAAKPILDASRPDLQAFVDSVRVVLAQTIMKRIYSHLQWDLAPGRRQSMLDHVQLQLTSIATIKLFVDDILVAAVRFDRTTGRLRLQASPKQIPTAVQRSLNAQLDIWTPQDTTVISRVLVLVAQNLLLTHLAKTASVPADQIHVVQESVSADGHTTDGTPAMIATFSKPVSAMLRLKLVPQHPAIPSLVCHFDATSVPMTRSTASAVAPPHHHDANRARPVCWTSLYADPIILATSQAYRLNPLSPPPPPPATTELSSPERVPKRPKPDAPAMPPSAYVHLLDFSWALLNHAYHTHLDDMVHKLFPSAVMAVDSHRYRLILKPSSIDFDQIILQLDPKTDTWSFELHDLQGRWHRHFQQIIKPGIANYDAARRVWLIPLSEPASPLDRPAFPSAALSRVPVILVLRAMSLLYQMAACLYDKILVNADMYNRFFGPMHLTPTSLTLFYGWGEQSLTIRIKTTSQSNHARPAAILSPSCDVPTPDSQGLIPPFSITFAPRPHPHAAHIMMALLDHNDGLWLLNLLYITHAVTVDIMSFCQRRGHGRCSDVHFVAQETFQGQLVISSMPFLPFGASPPIDDPEGVSPALLIYFLGNHCICIDIIRLENVAAVVSTNLATFLHEMAQNNCGLTQQNVATQTESFDPPLLSYTVTSRHSITIPDTSFIAFLEPLVQTLIGGFALRSIARRGGIDLSVPPPNGGMQAVIAVTPEVIATATWNGAMPFITWKRRGHPTSQNAAPKEPGGNLLPAALEIVINGFINRVMEHCHTAIANADALFVLITLPPTLIVQVAHAMEFLEHQGGGIQWAVPKYRDSQPLILHDTAKGVLQIPFLVGPGATRVILEFYYQAMRGSIRRRGSASPAFGTQFQAQHLTQAIQVCLSVMEGVP